MLKKKLKEDPDRYVITYRGFGHYNIEEKLTLQGYEVYTSIPARIDFSRTSSGYYMINYKNEIFLSDREIEKIILQAAFRSNFSKHLYGWVDWMNYAGAIANATEVFSRDELYKLVKDSYNYMIDDFLRWLAEAKGRGFNHQEYYNYLKRVLEDANFISEVNKTIKSYNLQAVVLDFDNTLTTKGESASDWIVLQIYELLKQGIKVIIVTGSPYEDTEKKLLEKLKGLEKLEEYQDVKWENLFLATNIGSKGYKFEDGNPIDIFDNPLNEKHISAIKDAIRQLESKFGNIILEHGKDNQYKYYLTFQETVKPEQVQAYGDFLQERFKNYGLKISCPGGCRTLEITVSNKADALSQIREKFGGFEKGNTIAIGDSFSYKYSADRNTLEEANLAFNVSDWPNYGEDEAIWLSLLNFRPGPERTSLIMNLILRNFRK